MNSETRKNHKTRDVLDEGRGTRPRSEFDVFVPQGSLG